MALVAVKFLLEKLAILLQGEIQLLGGIHEEVNEIKDELEIIRSFLLDADRRSETDQSVKTWVNQVREVAYDIEDVLDKFMICLANPHGRGFIHSIRNLLRRVKQLKARHDLAIDINGLKRRIKAISDRRRAYAFERIEEKASADATLNRLNDSRFDPLYINEADVVGIEKPRDLLIKWLREGESRLTTVSVVGLGGLGKTTLVKKVYDSQTVKGHFDCHAWVTISKSFTTGDLLRTALKGFLESTKEPPLGGLERMSDEELIEALRNHLNSKRSNNGVNSYPQELEELSRSILKKCGGLPLAIVAIGGLLWKKEKTVTEWKKVHSSLGAEMRNEHDLENLGSVLMSGYNHLPYYLKYCYLYLSVFPEDHLIRRIRLVRLWVAEGFIEEIQGLTAEEVAECYLNELISRSLIQVVETDEFNRVRTLRLHDLMREIVLLKSKEESFCRVIGEERLAIDQKARRLSIQTTLENFPLGTAFPSLRSLLVFVFDRSSYSFGHSFFHSFKFLRVLELELAPLHQFPVELLKLIHLRYLSLRGTMIKKLPKSFGKLRNLEVLDLKGTEVSILPSGILKSSSLREIRIFHYRFESSKFFANTHGVIMPSGIGRLLSLERLSIIEVNHDRDQVIELGRLTQLRRLGISKLRREDGENLCSSLEKLKHLTSFHVISEAGQHLQLESVSSPPPLLQHLYLKGRLATLPSWVISLTYLLELRLQYSRLTEDPFMALQEIPNLVYLDLREAYDGEELSCNAGGFRRLKKLGIQQLEQLKCVRLAEGAMPMLRTLEITGCLVLQTLPLGIENLSNLEELHLWDMPLRFMGRVRNSGDDGWKIQHVPTIKHAYESNGRWVVHPIPKVLFHPDMVDSSAESHLTNRIQNGLEQSFYPPPPSSPSLRWSDDSDQYLHGISL
ncbi:disease resistance protein RPM1-like [Macadamia integrifolia]|uniref:disease resistance protein RPM1-like n=1 Tax=Macadamia integrifolia TaxID=60698 RepID=UPI001C52D776|nr:disease resistance protein RPM1-like [Macadamia integrifolia]